MLNAKHAYIPVYINILGLHDVQPPSYVVHNMFSDVAVQSFVLPQKKKKTVTSGNKNRELVVSLTESLNIAFSR